MINAKKQAQPFRIEISYSKIHAACIFGSHILAALAVILAAIPLIIKFSIIICILFSLGVSWRQIQSLSIRHLQYTLSGAWEIECNALMIPIHILPESVITPLVIFLYFEKQSMEKQSMLIFKDAVSHEAYRVLTVSLKIHCFND